MSFESGRTGAQVLAALDLAQTARQQGVSIPWTEVSGRPATFPPEAHTHLAAQITGLAAVATSGAYSDLTGRPVLAAVATSGAYSDLSGRPGNFAGSAPGLVPTPGAGVADRFLRADGAFVEVPGSGGGGTVGWADVTGKPTTFPPSAHTHTIEQVTDLDTALGALGADIEQAQNDIGALTSQINAAAATTPYWFNTADPAAPRPADVADNRRVLWGTARQPAIAAAGGVWTPTLSGPPNNAELVDAYDPPTDRFDIALTANGTLANMLRPGGAALSSAEVNRTGVFVVTQDATGSRTLTPASGSHYLLYNDALVGGALPISTAANSVTLIYYHIVSATVVALFVARAA